ncbi:uncharacterized protein DSM5745_05699 [Aspergillus mulundensis]|uniref:Ysc84 actin-binding domain-containing protein n=1 Tax=Aspergillus mulundensis TaxID=1810919 RepID=A0A3D8RXR4_9EURO|nr:hypothetical protein DSM5745_05699 [Aspergillus mulundensis]RDW78847.1 hypothetical protein DSM5745_05699 [Aspergillus mulundensis]
MHYPLSSSFTSPSLAGECNKAQKILDSFINPEIVSVDKRIPRKVLENAKGLAIFSVFEVGMMRSLRIGSGLVVARLANGTWSAPSAITTGKLATKGQFGMELTEFVYVLNSDAAVEKFSQSKNFTLGHDVSIAVGPFGRSAELTGDEYVADIFAYCKTRAVFGGSTLEGATIGERIDANRKIYQKAVTARQLLRGEVTLPPETYGLMKILHSTMLRSITRTSSVDRVKIVKTAPQHSAATKLRARSSTTAAPVKEEDRFYGPQIVAPHQITIEITDWSAVELPSSLTSYQEPRISLESEPAGSSTEHPTILKPGRRTWSATSSGSWSSHESLHF